MIAKVNIVQAATLLAEEDLRTKVLNLKPSEIASQSVDELIDKTLYDENGNYRDEWQDEFNYIYDYYFEVISNCIVE
jgi:hypothetical protein